MDRECEVIIESNKGIKLKWVKTSKEIEYETKK